ncbi:MAG: sigma-54-dependent transcriptional regulator [Thermodesulfovibrionales bacterium]
MSRILVIDDDDVVRDVLNTYLTGAGFEVVMACNGREGLDVAKEENFDLIITDLMMPQIGGIEVLKELSLMNNTAPVIVITAYGTVQNAVEAMKLGAIDYITRPFNLEEFGIVINRAIGISRLQKENLFLKKQLKKKYRFEGLVGDSPAMQKVYEMIEKIADTESTVLITGESGTGKEMIAKTIHYSSSRSEAPFIPVNCAAIPKDLLESELFGHEKGAFTGALNTRIGRFELANRGTLFLDEVGELAPHLQVKLLRVLQEREFERVGGIKTIKVDVRILAATNSDLERAVKDGRFREDLYYRLNVIPLQIPPLRKRKEDIPLLLDHFAHEFAKKRKKQPLRFSKAAMNALFNYDWPGNVRELRNLVERLTILVNGDVADINDLPDKFHSETDAPSLSLDTITISTGDSKPIMENLYPVGVNDIPDEGINLNQIIDDMERNLILTALKKAGGVKSRAASLLNLNRTTLIEKMKKMGITSSN